MRHPKIYSVVFSPTVAAGAAANQSVNLNLAAVQFRVNRLTWGVRLEKQTVNLDKIDWRSDTTQIIELAIQYAGVAPSPLGSLAMPDPGTVLLNNGINVTLYEPGSYQFDNFFINNTITLYYSIINRDLLNAVKHYVSIITEIEIL